MRMIRSSLLAFACVLVAHPIAHADYLFSGSGSSGTLASPNEPWQFNGSEDEDAVPLPPGPNWISQGVYSEGGTVYGIALTFYGGGPINSETVVFENAHSGNCFVFADGDAGSYLCGIFQANGSIGNEGQGGPVYQTGPDSILLTAVLGTFPYIDNDYFYRAIVHFNGATPTSFTGAWLTAQPATPPPYMATPEPSSLVLLGTGVLSLVSFARRSRRS